ncbi:hypothetical protein HGRIS_003893 [Hohenbuehelia grisea]|uniref:Uncharacterized protein n=1 Tax=Hohenbuehelia grisea TaxID=104357 RepID=A0ABR3JGU6_9AGAR
MSNFSRQYGAHNIHFPPPFSEPVQGPLPPVQPPPMPDRPERYPDGHKRYPSEKQAGHNPTSFHAGQKVEVCLRADFWVVGVVLGAVHFIDRLTGRASYSIQYIKSPQHQQPHWDTGEFYSDNIRPFRQ